MNNAVGMGLGATINIPHFIRIGSGIQKLIAGIQTAGWSHKPTFIFTK
jgi:hypothetical protein